MRQILLTNGEYAIVDDDAPEVVFNLRWHKSTRGYAIFSTSHSHHGNKVVFRMHRVIMNAPPGTEVDHINGNPLDNRRENLRLASHRENAANQVKQRVKRSSRYKGVTYYKRDGNWQAKIHKGGVTHHLGYFNDEVDAARAYNTAARGLFGTFAHVNRLPEDI